MVSEKEDATKILQIGQTFSVSFPKSAGGRVCHITDTLIYVPTCWRMPLHDRHLGPDSLAKLVSRLILEAGDKYGEGGTGQYLVRPNDCSYRGANVSRTAAVLEVITQGIEVGLKAA